MRKTLTALSITAALVAALCANAHAYDPLAGVRGDVSRILDPATSTQELDRISARHQRWVQQNQGMVAAEEIRHGAQRRDYQQMQRQAEHRALMEANRTRIQTESLLNDIEWRMRNQW